MGIYDIIKSRRSIRNYKNNKIPIETVLKIIGAARKAPSWGNKQCWRFVIVDSVVEKKILGKASGQDYIAKACDNAPYVIVICAGEKDSGVKNGMSYFMFDCGLAVENLVLAASSEGLSTCIVGWVDEKAVRGVLNIPEDIRAIAFITLGYADEEVLERPRKKENEVVFYNHWGKTIGN